MTYRLLNLACGSKISKVGNWTNVDFQSPLENVIELDILQNLTYPTGTFDVVYSSQFIEHLTLKEGKDVLVNIAKIMKPNGVIRLVTPDLEELCSTYLETLKILKGSSDAQQSGRYDWIKLEMFDQVVRDVSGGAALEFLDSCDNSTKNYFSERIGLSSSGYFDTAMSQKEGSAFQFLKEKFNRLPRWTYRNLRNILATDTMRIGRFRRSGEVHRYMHDVFSLTRLLNESGFRTVRRVSPHKSRIADWKKYQLDVVDGVVDAPLSLFIEAVR